MRIAFYLENQLISDIDFTEPEEGNPGCGGTQYLFVATPYYLSKKRGSEYTPVLLANHTEKLPVEIENARVKDVYDAAKTAKRLGCDLFVYRPKRDVELDVVELIDDLELPSIAWAHVQLPTKPLKKMARSNYLKMLVCVEHEQYDQLQDTKLAVQGRITYIVNGFDLDAFRLPDPPQKDEKLVAYIGALVPTKGFHVLAQAWPGVLKRVPDARLTVIGSGALYDHKAQLGPWGIAEKSYEEKHIIPFLEGDDGKTHPSVLFAGRLGLEKKDILHQALVGVANPTGASENCPGSALEFSASGTAIASGGYRGMLDTILDKETGLLGKTDEDLTDNICRLLENPDYARRLGDRGVMFVRERYNWDKVIYDWGSLFNVIGSGAKLRRIPFKNNFFAHYKILVMLNRLFQLSLGRVVNWPSLEDIKRKVRSL